MMFRVVQSRRDWCLGWGAGSTIGIDAWGRRELPGLDFTHDHDRPQLPTVWRLTAIALRRTREARPGPYGTLQSPERHDFIAAAAALANQLAAAEVASATGAEASAPGSEAPTTPAA